MDRQRSPGAEQQGQAGAPLRPVLQLDRAVRARARAHRRRHERGAAVRPDRAGRRQPAPRGHLRQGRAHAVAPADLRRQRHGPRRPAHRCRPGRRRRRVGRHGRPAVGDVARATHRRAARRGRAAGRAADRGARRHPGVRPPRPARPPVRHDRHEPHDDRRRARRPTAAHHGGVRRDEQPARRARRRRAPGDGLPVRPRRPAAAPVQPRRRRAVAARRCAGLHGVHVGRPRRRPPLRLRRAAPPDRPVRHRGRRRASRRADGVRRVDPRWRSGQPAPAHDPLVRCGRHRRLRRVRLHRPCGGHGTRPAHRPHRCGRLVDEPGHRRRPLPRRCARSTRSAARSRRRRRTAACSDRATTPPASSNR